MEDIAGGALWWVSIAGLMLGSGGVASLLTSWWDKRAEDRRYWLRERHELYVKVLKLDYRLRSTAHNLRHVAKGNPRIPRELRHKMDTEFNDLVLTWPQISLLSTPEAIRSVEQLYMQWEGYLRLVKSEGFNGKEGPTVLRKAHHLGILMNNAFREELGIKPLGDEWISWVVNIGEETSE